MRRYRLFAAPCESEAAADPLPGQRIGGRLALAGGREEPV